LALRPLPLAAEQPVPALRPSERGGRRAGARFERKPSWLKVRAPGGERYASLKRLVREHRLHTVCEEARCPNIGECWNEGTATVMLLGDACTRACRFCDVRTQKTPPAPDPEEPQQTAEAVRALELRYVVLTMVDRDDLPDGGAAHVARTVRAVRRESPATRVEVLTGDLAGDPEALRVVAASGADCLAHNIETVRRLQGEVRDARCGYDRSLEVLRVYRALRPDAFVKSSLMLGLGERLEEVEATLGDLRRAGVDIVTLGQYLRPSEWHLPVKEYVAPARFDALAGRARAFGFRHCAAGPLVRSSYKAAEAFVLGARAVARPPAGA